MNEFIIRNFSLPFHEVLRGRKTLPYFRFLQNNEKLSQQQLLEYQKNKLRLLLHHCKNEVPYYQQVFREAGLEFVNKLDIKELSTLPILTKADIRADLNKFIAPSRKHTLIKYSTGGSTGEPLVFYTDKEKESLHKAHDWRCRAWFGVMPGDRQTDLWGSSIELDKMSWFRSFKDRYLLNHIVLSAFELREDRLLAYTNIIKKFTPRLIYGYPTVLYRLAQFILGTGIQFYGYRPKLISCTSEMLYDDHRETIQKAFGCPVANEYGSRDGGLIAHECPQANLHIAAEHVIVEVDKPDEDGVGDLIVTNLDGFGMPFIRYRIGDRGSLSDENCSCGSSLPILSKISGRSNDFLVGKNGKMIHSLAVIYAFRDYRDKLQQFKIIQKKIDIINIQLVCLTPLNQSELDIISQKMKTILESDVTVNFTFMDSIDPEKSGKYRWVIREADIILSG